MYDTYSRYIYEWLVNSSFSDDLSNLLATANSIFKVLIVFFFAFVAFKFLRKEWLSY